VRDVTERKRIEQESLRTAQLVSIGELAAGVAHEINNPIMGVINYAQIMLNDNRAQGGDIEIPARIIKEGERIAGIVSNLLNLARPVGNDFSAVSVRGIFELAYQLMQKLLQQSDVIVDVQFSDDLPIVRVFPQKIQQVFINIISNALYALNMRFTGPHPDKRFEVRFKELSDARKKFVRVVFMDYGCGIKAEDLLKIFNPFFTTKPMGMGTGLGLSISYKIIQEHEGRLLFESTPGEYTRVFVDLPVAQ
jgi:signal transduction histidine kinase